jgi:hypothetical protein
MKTFTHTIEACDFKSLLHDRNLQSENSRCRRINKINKSKFLDVGGIFSVENFTWIIELSMLNMIDLGKGI